MISMTCTPTWQGEPRAYDAVVRQLAMRALERSTDSRVEAFVSHGCVILSGTVDSDGERIDAVLAVSGVPGVTDVLNCIHVTPSAEAAGIHGGSRRSA